ncbi:MAG TPA: hypothetical protein VMM18_04155 [Gemmatimonadaceae bacterium]|nr:hypothetical protein [Gemmatimonadaceae bacterium]
MHHRVRFALAPLTPVTNAELATLRSELARQSGVSGLAGTTVWAAVDDGIRPEIRLFLIGLLDARLGDEAGAEESARALEAVTESGVAVAVEMAILSPFYPDPTRDTSERSFSTRSATAGPRSARTPP